MSEHMLWVQIILLKHLVPITYVLVKNVNKCNLLNTLLLLTNLLLSDCVDFHGLQNFFRNVSVTLNTLHAG